MTGHKRGTTPRFELDARDFGGALFDPDTHSAKIYNEAGALQKTETNPTKESTGKFYFYWTIPADGAAGTWKLEWTCVKATYTSIEDKTFEVVE